MVTVFFAMEGHGPGGCAEVQSESVFECVSGELIAFRPREQGVSWASMALCEIGM